MNKERVLLGAVAYTPAVVEIWEGIKDYFNENGCPFDFVLFSNYEAQVDALLDGFIDIAWNTNLAFIKCDLALSGKARILAMRDTDLDFTSHIVVKKDSSINSIEDLKQKRVAFGSKDSAQAAIMPEYFLLDKGLVADRDYTAIRFNSDVGKHGDTGNSEHEVVDSVLKGEVDAGTIGATIWQQLKNNGADLKCIWSSPGYSHCIFTALPNLDEKKAENFTTTLMKMDYQNPDHKRLLDLEGLKKWVPPSRDGYKEIFKAVEKLNYATTTTVAAR